jgi:protein TonB
MLISDGKAALFRDDAQQRALAACIGASIVLHVLALFSFPGLRSSTHAGSPKVLTATFALRSESPETAPSIEEATPRPSESPRRELKPEPPRPVLARSAPADPDVAQPVAPAPVPVPSRPVQTANSAPAPLASATQPQASATSDVTAVKSSTDAADPGLLERYRLALIDATKRYRRYPVQAMERGWQGRVEIRMVIGANGTIRDALIKTSSNYQILDDQALDMVKRGKPLTPIPAALHGREFTVDVPVIFELQTG